MYFGLSEEQQSFQEIIRKFLDDEATIEKIKLFNKGDLSDFPETIHKGLLELGFNGLINPFNDCLYILVYFFFPSFKK